MAPRSRDNLDNPNPYWWTEPPLGVPRRPSPTTRKPPKASAAPYRPPAPPVSRTGSFQPGDLLRGDTERQSRDALARKIFYNAGDVTQFPTMEEILVSLLGSDMGPGPGAGPGGGGRGGGGGGGGGGVSRKNIEDAIKAMTEGATAAQSRIGEIYAGADRTLGELTQQYAAAQDALRAGGARTLGAFGVEGGMLDPMAQTAAEGLAATRGTLAGLSADQQARLEAQKAAYSLILGDLLR